MSKTTTPQQDVDRLIEALGPLMEDLGKAEKGRLIQAFDDAKGTWFEDMFGPLMAAHNSACLHSARRRAQALLAHP